MKLFPSRKAPYFYFKLLIWLGFLGGLVGAILLVGVLIYFANQVPDYRQLADYKPNLITKVYSHDGSLLAEYAKERRIYVPISEIPQAVINAFIAAEDADFYKHEGFDLKGIIRATLINTFTSSKQGASTITQQVAKTFLLTSERTYTRKIKELILARRIEAAFSKNEILELYLNQIYLGNGAYGVAAAAKGYFNKGLEELTIVQRAILAGLPKAPSRYNPLRNPRKARWRRDVIIGRMKTQGFISQYEAVEAIASDLQLNPQRLLTGKSAPHFSEYVRRYIAENYGNEQLYKGGYRVFTTLDKNLQKYAENAVYRGLREYDRRHGYRGAVGKMPILINWQARINEEAKKWRHRYYIGVPAVVLEVDEDNKQAVIGLPSRENSTDNKGIIPFKVVTWARQYIDADKRGSKVKNIADVLAVGDIILVKSINELPVFDNAKHGDFLANQGMYSLEQIPRIQGALVAIDTHSGAVRAMVGGLGDGTGFNRAVQAKRQAGSAFKPIVYSLALDSGYTPASIVMDAPVVFKSSGSDEAWKPRNYSEKVYGPSTLRRGLEKSRNLMTVRLARDLGIRNIIAYARRFGLTAPMENDLSTALGSSSFSLLELTSAYSVFPNQGIYVEPFFVENIEDSTGDIIYRNMSQCLECSGEAVVSNILPPLVKVAGNEIIPADTAYQMVSLLRGTVQRGTAWRARATKAAVGAKTGTTNDYIDAWLLGFSPGLAIGVWVGFDNPQTMGNQETGSKASAPIWTYFATEALRDKRNETYAIPEGISFVRIDAKTGGLPNAETKSRLLEVFKIGTEPTAQDNTANPSGGVKFDFGGIY